jgi:y4mF family transcriptional regulator
MNHLTLNEYVKSKRKALELSREELALKAGVGLRFLRELEQGKETLRMDKVNQVLNLFGVQLGAVPMECLQNSSFQNLFNYPTESSALSMNRVCD